MTEHVSATLVDRDTLLVDGVPFDRRSAEPTPAPMDGTITACANLAARYGLDLQAAIDRVETHNRERGRYE